ncbi:EamA family transporter RarD [Corynebacterium frankenforstense]|uniref:EamA family transporter RarD n=1 Tax=Corynebacterium frankenforstense TaxID=1230998 RepID=UPI00254F6C15|nr:EamA family transporter RarD [Corynebacterium frankenforstense]MDK6259076.1 EamA family transporter RarD [Corynebacterium frankenforstense]
MLFGVLAYLLWGVFPAFFPLLLPAGPLEILAHRIVWTALLMVVVLAVTRGWRELRAAGRAQWARMALAGVVVAGNWLIYVVAVNSGHVADAALGYFINPIVSVLLGVLFLNERLRPAQTAAVGIAAVGVVWLAVLGEQPPVMGVGLALTFGCYGLLKKKVTVSSAASLTAETLVLTPVAAVYLAVLAVGGQATFGNAGATNAALLAVSGVVTALPLLLFGAAAHRLPLATIGMLQFLTPTMQMLWALFVVDEQLSPARWAGFVIIWVAVAVFIADIARTARRARRARCAGAAPIDDAPRGDAAG